MQRQQLEHIIRAAAGITGATDIIVIGSQALLGQFPDSPADLLVSIEADVFTFRDPADAELIEGSIGEGSPFHQTFGYYAHGVSAETAVLPAGWRDRLIPVRNANTGNGCGLCLEAHDLTVAKLAAGREKDVAFVASLLRHKLVKPSVVESRLRLTTLDNEELQRAVARLKKLAPA